MICKKCGFENLDEASFCIKCGSRLDEKIPCPKCGEYIDNDADTCPHCGKQIPHKKEAHLAYERVMSPKRKQIANVFNLVSVYVSLFLFIMLSMTIFFCPVNDVTIFTSYFYFEPGAFSDWRHALSQIDVFIIAFNALFVFAVSVIGVVKTSKKIKNRENLSSIYKYLIMAVLANSFTVALLYAFSPNTTNYFVTSYISSINSLALTHLCICIGFDCFLHFKKGQISIFIARIILGLSLFIFIGMLSCYTIPFIKIEDSFQGFVFHFAYMTSLLSTNAGSGTFISAYVFNSVNLLLGIAILISIYFIGTFFVSSYFEGMNRFKKFRITFYMSSIGLSILASIYFVSSLVQFFLYQDLFIDGNCVTIILTPMVLFLLSILLMGVTVTTFNIYNHANRRASLEERTTIK